MFFWCSLGFLIIQWMLVIRFLVSLLFLNPALTSGSSWFLYCWSLAWRILSIGSVVKNPPAQEGDVDSIPGLAKSPGEGNGNRLQYSCLGNPMAEESVRPQSMGLWESTTTYRLNNNNTGCQETRFTCLCISNIQQGCWQLGSGLLLNHSVVSGSLQPHGLQPTSLLHP